ncbi:MAG: outer membrane lipid asymmetry maintenance protein MlaD [Candidatus Tectimicrobiota bacterium]
MQRIHSEIVVALFVIVGLCALGYLMLRLGNLRLWPGTTYDLTATFPSAAGLHAGATVAVAGVKVGWVEQITLHNYAAVVTLRLEKRMRLQDDTSAAIRTRGLLGEKYVLLTPGNSERLLRPGERIREVEASVNIETLIGRFIQGTL